jgi:hypothetical protein
MNHALMVLETASRPNSGHFACFYVLSLSGLSQTAKGISLKQRCAQCRAIIPLSITSVVDIMAKPHYHHYEVQHTQHRLVPNKVAPHYSAGYTE